MDIKKTSDDKTVLYMWYRLLCNLTELPQVVKNMQVVIGTGRPKLAPRCRSETRARNWSLADQRRVSVHIFAYASWLGVNFDVDFVYVELWEC